MKIFAFIMIFLAFSFIHAELVAYYDFNGDLLDSTSYANNAIAYGNAKLIEDRFGNANSAYWFDGDGDYLRIPNAAQINFGLNQDFTISFWLKAGANQVDLGNGDNDVVEKWSGGEGYPFVVRYVHSNGTMHAARYNGSASSGADSNGLSINDGQFHNIIFMKSGSTLSFYVDGILKSTGTDLTSGVTANTSDLYIACRGVSYNFFTGAVDELMIYNTSLAQSEITGLSQIPEASSVISLVLGLFFCVAKRIK